MNEKVLSGIAAVLFVLGVVLWAIEEIVWGLVCIVPAILLAASVIYEEKKKKKAKDEQTKNNPSTVADNNISTEQLESEGKRAAALIADDEIDTRIAEIEMEMSELEGAHNPSSASEKKTLYSQQYPLAIEKRELILRKMSLMRAHTKPSTVTDNNVSTEQLESEGKRAAALIADDEIDKRINEIEMK